MKIAVVIVAAVAAIGAGIAGVVTYKKKRH